MAATNSCIHDVQCSVWLHPLSVSPWWAAATFCLSRKFSKTSRLVWPRLLLTIALVPGPSVYKILCALIMSEVSISPQYCGAPEMKPHWLSNSNALGAHLPGAPCGGLQKGVQNSHFCGRTFTIYVFSSLWVAPRGLGFNYVTNPSLLPVSLWFFMSLIIEDFFSW